MVPAVVVCDVIPPKDMLLAGFVASTPTVGSPVAEAGFAPVSTIAAVAVWPEGACWPNKPPAFGAPNPPVVGVVVP